MLNEHQIKELAERVSNHDHLLTHADRTRIVMMLGELMGHRYREQRPLTHAEAVARAGAALKDAERLVLGDPRTAVDINPEGALKWF